MSDQRLFRRIAAIAAVLSMPLALGAFFLVSVAVDFNFELAADQASLISLDAQAAEILRWGEILGGFGYYLLLLPVVLYLREWLRPHSPNLVNLYTVCGLGFAFIGAAGAVLRAGAMPEMITAYAQATGAEREMLIVAFTMLTGIIFSALGLLEAVLLGVWWLGIGLVLRRERSALGILTTILGIATLVSGVGTVVRIDALIALAAITWLLWPIWALWLGINIARHDKISDFVPEPAAAASHGVVLTG